MRLILTSLMLVLAMLLVSPSTADAQVRLRIGPVGVNVGGQRQPIRNFFRHRQQNQNHHRNVQAVIIRGNQAFFPVQHQRAFQPIVLPDGSVVFAPNNPSYVDPSFRVTRQLVPPGFQNFRGQRNHQQRQVFFVDRCRH